MRELDSKIVNCGVIKIMRVVNFKLCRAKFVVNDIVLTDWNVVILRDTGSHVRMTQINNDMSHDQIVILHKFVCVNCSCVYN